jgi:phenylalanyl-tRNA synthetase beta chain
VELSRAHWVGEVEVQGDLPAPPVVQLRPERTSALIGLDVPAGEQLRILGSLGFEAGPGGAVTVPTWRARDVTREVDLVEEVARFVLGDVPFTLPLRRVVGRLTPEQRLRRRIEDVLVGFGLAEAYTPSLVESDPDERALALPQPLTSEHAVLRTTLLPSLVEAARRNAETGNESVALFELAHVYLPGAGELSDEPWRVAGVVEGSFSRAKGIVEGLYRVLKHEPRFEPATASLLHPGKTARSEAGLVGQLHPSVLEGEWSAFELDVASLAAVAAERIRYRDVITFPAVKQDLAFTVDEDVPAGALVEAAREAAGPELREMRVFDVYRGDQIAPGKKSLAFSVAFQSPERTLSDEDAARLRSRIVEALASRFGAELRA